MFVPSGKSRWGFSFRVCEIRALLNDTYTKW